MTRWAMAGLVAVGLLATPVVQAGADDVHVSPYSHGHGYVKSPLEIHAENPRARYDPKVQAREIERRLRRPNGIGYYPYGLTPHDDGAALDQQIRRLGDAIRRREREGQ